jgi:hypothetical protein
MRVELRQDQLSGNWVLKVLEAIHNHGPSAASIALHTDYLLYHKVIIRQ